MAARLQHRPQHADGLRESGAVPLDSRDGRPQVPFWLTSVQAAAYVGNRSVRAFYAWRKVHHIIPRRNGTVCRLDLDRALRVPRKRNVMHANSLANLRAGGKGTR